MSPSTGMRSPGSTLTMSPGLMLLVGTMAKSISGALPACDGSSRDAGFMTMRDWAGISLASVWRSATGNKGCVRYSNTRERSGMQCLSQLGTSDLGGQHMGPAACAVQQESSFFKHVQACCKRRLADVTTDSLHFVMHVVDLGQLYHSGCRSACMSTPATSELVKVGSPASAPFCPAESWSLQAVRQEYALRTWYACPMQMLHS